MMDGNRLILEDDGLLRERDRRIHQKMTVLHRAGSQWHPVEIEKIEQFVRNLTSRDYVLAYRRNHYPGHLVVDGFIAKSQIKEALNQAHHDFTVIHVVGLDSESLPFDPKFPF
jgi:hypothetical protein